MTHLQALAGQRYRVVDDGTADPCREERPWCQEIRGRYGAIYPYARDGRLAVRIEAPRIAARAEAWGYPAIQRGEAELVLVFPARDLDRVAALIRAQRRRRLSPEQRASLLKRLGRADSKPVSVPEEATSRP